MTFTFIGEISEWWYLYFYSSSLTSSAYNNKVLFWKSKPTLKTLSWVLGWTSRAPAVERFRKRLDVRRSDKQCGARPFRNQFKIVQKCQCRNMMITSCLWQFEKKKKNFVSAFKDYPKLVKLSALQMKYRITLLTYGVLQVFTITENVFLHFVVICVFTVNCLPPV